MSRDTIPGSVNHPLSLHRYLYTLANPVNAVDLSGNQTTLLELSAELSIDTNFQYNFAKEGLKAIGVVRIVSAPLLEAAYELQGVGLLGIAEDAPAAYDLYSAGQSLELAALGTLQEAILNIYLDTLKAGLPKLKVTVGGLVGKALNLSESIDKLESAIEDLSTIDVVNNPIDAIGKVKAVRDAVDSIGSDYEKEFKF